MESHLPGNLPLAFGSYDKDLFPNIYCFPVIACTQLIFSAQVERSFSLLRIITTYLRFTMSEEHL